MEKGDPVIKLWEQIKKTQRQQETLIKLCIPSEDRKNKEMDFEILRKWMQLLIDFPTIRKYAKEIEHNHIEEIIRAGIKQDLYKKWRCTVKSPRLEELIKIFDPLICAGLELQKPHTGWIKKNIKLITPWHPVKKYVLLPVDANITFNLRVERVIDRAVEDFNDDDSDDWTHLFIDSDTYNISQEAERLGSKIIMKDFIRWGKIHKTRFQEGFGAGAHVREDIINLMKMYLTAHDIGLSIELMKMGNYPIGFTWDQKRLIIMCSE